MNTATARDAVLDVHWDRLILLATNTACKREEEYMLQVNLRDSDFAVGKSVMRACNVDAKASSVRIMRLPVPFAIVEAPDALQSMQLATELGAYAFGRYVIVNLEDVLPGLAIVNAGLAAHFARRTCREPGALL
jgi:hypothetical protein